MHTDVRVPASSGVYGLVPTDMTCTVGHTLTKDIWLHQFGEQGRHDTVRIP